MGIGRKPALAIMACLTLALAGCDTLSSEFPRYLGLPTGKYVGAAPPQSEDQRKIEQAWLGEDQAVEWGIAMSGGGLRSALYNVGALKALYDNGVLQKADYLSAVSGGGYSLYWLYRNEADRSMGAEFGAKTFENTQFMQNVCELSRRANFVTYGKIMKLLGGKLQREARDVYQRGILRTFGGVTLAEDEVPTPVLPIWKVENPDGKVPFPVVNATINDWDHAGTWRSRLFEFSPLQYGNDELGYNTWQRGSDQGPGWYRLAAISGAAHEVLTDKFESIEAEGTQMSVPLFDGGKSENLGAIALIRRGVPNIVIVDAEHDPAHQFGGYIRLKDQLASNYGLILSVPGIDTGHFPSYLADWDSSAFLGRVTDDKGNHLSNIYYQKMAVSRPVSMRFDQFGGEGDGAAQDRLYQREYLDGDCDGKTQIDLPIWAAYAGGSYKGYLERKRFLSKVVNALPGRALKHHFPHYTTTDQSFYLDQAEAFVAIGYLNGLEMTAKLKD